MRVHRKLLGILLLLTAVCLLPNDLVSANENVGTIISAPDNIRSIRKSDTAIRLEWKAVPDADGYFIYRCQPSTKKFKKVHTVKGTKVNQWMKWTDKKRKTNKIYKYKLASYKMVNGQRQVSTLSDWVSAKTYQRNSKKINARAPKISKKEVYLGLCSSKKISSYVEPAKYGKNKKKKPFSKKVRWYSSNPMVAKVNKKGVITAGEKPGTCNVYAKAHNGLRSRVKVTVKNYARVKSYYGRYVLNDDIYLLTTKYRVQMQNVAEYYSINRIPLGKKIEFRLNKDAEVVITPANADIGNLKKDIETLLVDFPYYIDINVTAVSVEYVLRLKDDEKEVPGYVRFWFNNNCSKWGYRAASHWEAVRRAGI